jgi:hypothetical protein
MSLYTRMLGIDLPRIPVHDLMAALGEVERDRVTTAAVATAFGLDAGEQTEMETLAAKVIVPQESLALGAFVTLTNVGAAYDAITASRGLGFVGLQTAGIMELTFAVKVSKVGTGTQSWQLWNETDTAQVGVIDDAGVAGDKTLSTIITPSPAPMVAGFKVLRVRAKSTVAADDPLYYGAAIRLKRTERMTSVELHEVLLLASGGRAYTTEAALKTRLGV